MGKCTPCGLKFDSISEAKKHWIDEHWKPRLDWAYGLAMDSMRGYCAVHEKSTRGCCARARQGVAA